MATFTTLAKFIPQTLLQYKDSWAWQKFYPAKFFGYTVSMSVSAISKSSRTSEQNGD